MGLPAFEAKQFIFPLEFICTEGEPAFVIKTMRHKYFTLVMRYLALMYSLKPGAIPALLIIMN